MNRLLLLSAFLALLIFCVLITVSCGNLFVRGAINPGAQTMNGTVSVVQFSDGSGETSVTIITLTSNGMASTLNFCRDQRPQFPPNSQVQVSFTPGTACDHVLAVHLI